jgi:hypothetical protein
MPNADSSLVDDAIIATLLKDSQLRTLCPDGVWSDQAGEGKERFVIISLVDHNDVPVFEGRGFEDALYLVKAVIKNGKGDIKGACGRIDEILSGADGRGAIIPVADFGELSIAREARVRYTEVDDQEPTLRWLHRGGRYRVHAALA